MKKIGMISLMVMALASTNVSASGTYNEDSATSNIMLGSAYLTMIPLVPLVFVSIATGCAAEKMSSRAGNACKHLKETQLGSTSKDKVLKALSIKDSAREVIGYESEEMASELMGIYQMGLSIEKQREMSVTETSWYSLSQSPEQIHQTLNFAVEQIAN